MRDWIIALTGRRPVSLIKHFIALAIIPAVMKRLVLGWVCAAVLLSACAGAAATPAPVTLQVLSPQPGVPMLVGAPVRVEGSVNGRAGTLVLLANGLEIARQPVGDTASVIAADWTPSIVGNQVFQVSLLNENGGTVARSELVFVSASAPTPTAQPTPIPSPTALPTQVAPPIAVAPQATATPVMTLSVNNSFVNLRSGPGTTFALLGTLNQGGSYTVTGRNADGRWYQIINNGSTVWVFSELVDANDAARAAPVVESPATPTPAPTLAAAPTAAALVALVPPTPVAPTAIPVTPTPAPPPCGPDHPFWAAKLNNNPEYTFCTPVPFEFARKDDSSGEMLIRWEIFGVRDIEMHMDPSGDNDCRALGSTGFRRPVNGKEDAYRMNMRDYPRGGYKLTIWVTTPDNRRQDWGEIHFCGQG
jgi:uncharacterized protein YraI